MGIKLVYYRVDSGSVLFGSELKAILAALPERPEIDITALNLFLRYRYTPSPLTLYQGIRKLAPGTMAIFENGEWSIQRWYQFQPHHFSPAKSDAHAQEELLDIYQRALKRHLISDVPLGLLLSGGVDSGLLLGLMSLYGDRTICRRLEPYSSLGSFNLAIWTILIFYNVTEAAFGGGLLWLILMSGVIVISTHHTAKATQRRGLQRSGQATSSSLQGAHAIRIGSIPVAKYRFQDRHQRSSG